MTRPVQNRAGSELPGPTPDPAAPVAGSTSRPAPRTGGVAFVGAGPGDASLLTLRAAELLAAADVVVVDDPAQRDLLPGLCRAAVEVIETAEAGVARTAGQRARQLTDAAKAGRAVVRLVAGDPAFSRTLADEVAACGRARIRVEVVPGVSAASAVPTYAGVPLVAGRATGVRIVDATAPGVEWTGCAAPDTTLVVVDVLDTLDSVAGALISGGRAASTPVAVTSGGATTSQRTVVSTLDRVAADVKSAELAGPTVAVVGPVVSLREKVSWFETRPLFGWRVLVPRTKEQAGALSSSLAAHGAVPEEVPTIAVEPPRTPQQMERAVKGLVTGRYEWIAFSSRNAVRAVRERIEAYGLDARALSGIKVAAVGEQTAADLSAWGIRADLVPTGEQSSAGLLEVWPPYDPVFDPIDRVFLPRADIATDTLVAGLRDLGWEIDDVTAYRTVRAAPPPAEIREAIKGGGFDAVVFTSSSTVRNLVGIAGKPHPSTVVACIGPQTARTAEEHGLTVDVLAPTPSIAALTAALAEYGGALQQAATSGAEPNGRPTSRANARRASVRRTAK